MKGHEQWQWRRPAAEYHRSLDEEKKDDIFRRRNQKKRNMIVF